MKPINKKNLAFLFVIWAITGFAQEQSFFIGEGEAKLQKIEAKAKDAFESKNYYGAYSLYRKALKIDSNKVINQYNLAKSAENYRAFCVAADAYDRVLVLDEAYPDAVNKYAMMQEKREQIESTDRSLMEIDQRANAPNADPSEIQYLPRKLDQINTQFAELNPVWRNGALYYGSLAYTKKKDSQKPKRFFAKTLQYNLVSPPSEWTEFNIQDQSVSNLSFTPDDKRVYFTICDYNDDGIIICQLNYRNKIKGTVNEWSNPIELPESINNNDYTSTQPSLGKNIAGDTVLYFVSNRPNNNGNGMDIWYTKILNDTSFAEPECLGSIINTPANEISPYFHFESNTLYFSSDKSDGFGGYDIYQIESIEKEGWANLENLDLPTNSGADDYNYFLTTKGEKAKAYYVTNREGCEPEIDSSGCYDIYEIGIRPCTTDANIHLIDIDTKEPLAYSKLGIVEGNTTLNAQASDYTSVTYLDTEHGIRSVIAAAEGYFPKDTTIDIVKCEENVFTIPICAPTLTVTVFGEGPKEAYAQSANKIPLNNFQLTIEAVDVPNNESLTFYSNEAYQITTKVLPNMRYKVTATHDKYDLNIKESDQILSCKNTIEILLPLPILPPLDSAIVCYFEHDKPDRIRDENGIVIQSMVRQSEYSFTAYYPDYNNLGEFYSQEFIKNKRGQRRITDSLNVQDFFQNQVIPNNNRLVNFRETLYQILSADATAKYDLEIIGYCSSTGSTDYNNKLAERRVECVIKFFLEDFGDKQISKRINPNQLGFTKVFKGERDFTPRYPDEDRTNSVYNPFSSDQRRVEVANYTRSQIGSPSIGLNDSRE